MNDRQQSSAANSRRLVRGLRELDSVEVPASLLPAVLVEVGLGDACFALDSPIGQIFVAYNNAGVTAVGHTADADSFAENFQRRFGRRVRLTPAPPVALARAVERRLRGERAEIRFDLRGLSEFERATLEKA